MEKELNELFAEKGKLVTELEIIQNKLTQINQLISNLISVKQEPKPKK